MLFAMVLPRVFFMLSSMQENYRTITYEYSHNLFDIVKIIFNPFGGDKRVSDNEFCFDYHELGFFIAPPLVIYYLKYFFKNFKYNIIFLWLFYSALYKNSFFSFTYLIHFLPGFSSHLCDTRLLIILYPMFFYGLLLVMNNVKNTKLDKYLLGVGFLIQIVVSIYLNFSIFKYENLELENTSRNKLLLVNIEQTKYDNAYLLYRRSISSNGVMQDFSPYGHLSGLDSSQLTEAINSISNYDILSISNNVIMIKTKCVCAIYLPFKRRFGLLIDNVNVMADSQQVHLESENIGTITKIEFNHLKYTTNSYENYINTWR